MIAHRVLWYKSWVESRSRFFAAVALMFVVVSRDVLDAVHAMSHFDRIPPITFPQYVAYVFGGRLQLIWVASALLFGLGGLVRESKLGTAQFTLSLPFRRREWMLVRAAIGLIQAATVALIPVLVIPLTSRVIGESYSVSEALKFSTVLFMGGGVFVFVGLFWSSLLAGDFLPLVAGGVSVLLVFTAQDYLYRWIPSFSFPYFNMSAFLGAHDGVDKATGFLVEWPWRGILKSVAVGAALCCVSVAVVKRRDF